MTLQLKKYGFFFLAAALPLMVLQQYNQQAEVFFFIILGVLISVFSYFYQLEKPLIYILVALLMVTVDLPVLNDSNLSLPSEILAAILAGSACLTLLLERAFRQKIKGSPLVWAILALILVFTITLFFSSMPKVSVKFVAINVGYILLALAILKSLLSQQIQVKNILVTMSISMFFLVLLSIYNLLPHSFNPGSAALIGKPFFKDHTVFSATIVLFIPLFFLVKTKSKNGDRLFVALAILLMVLVLLSSSRAAWLSLLISGFFFGFLKLKGQLKHLLIVVLFGIAMVYYFKSNIQEKFLVNPYQSTALNSSLQEQALSVTNITSDVSNMERLNRWKCAWRMFEEKPFTGFGPGTFQFQYLPFQQDQDLTYISVTSPFGNVLGRGGSAHSEYLLLLSETGIFGLLALCVIFVFILITVFKVQSSSLNSAQKRINLACFLSLTTYAVHGLFNNFLNSAQFGISFWMIMAFFIYSSIKPTLNGS